jgi:thioredoxin reductase (NADPH)
VVVGGGDSALEEAIFLTRFATKVTLVHRREHLRASKIMQDRAHANAKIEFAWNSVVDEVLGDQSVEAVRLRDVHSGDTRDHPTGAMFVAIGHDPNTELFRDQLEMTSNGYLVVDEPSTRTSVEGVFAAGDVVDFTYRQAVTAAGMGCKAAMDAEGHLESEGH